MEYAKQIANRPMNPVSPRLGPTYGELVEQLGGNVSILMENVETLLRRIEPYCIPLDQVPTTSGLGGGDLKQRENLAERLKVIQEITDQIDCLNRRVAGVNTRIAL